MTSALAKGESNRLKLDHVEHARGSVRVYPRWLAASLLFRSLSIPSVPHLGRNSLLCNLKEFFSLCSILHEERR